MNSERATAIKQALAEARKQAGGLVSALSGAPDYEAVQAALSACAEAADRARALSADPDAKMPEPAP